MDLLTPDEIVKAGFKYEPDASKCKTRKIRFHVDCNYYKDGQWKNNDDPNKRTLTQEWKDLLTGSLQTETFGWMYLNQVFVPDIQPMSGEGVMCRWAMIRGHGEPLTDRWFKTGLLDNVPIEKIGEAAWFLHDMAKTIISSSVDLKPETPEYKRYDEVTGIAIPVTRMLFDKFHPELPKAEWVWKECNKFFDERKGLYEDLKVGIAQDHEQQFAAFCYKTLEEMLVYEREAKRTDTAV